MAQTSEPLPLLRRPRALILTGFALALLFALAAPLAQLWRASVTPLDAQACVWPRVPLVGQPTQVVVTLPADLDHGDRRLTRAAAEWDMVSMRMGVRRATATPSPAERAGQTSAITIPLTLDMAGVWAAQVRVQTPGRPDWISTVQFTALAHRSAEQATAPAGVAGCADAPARAGVPTGGAP